MTRIPRSDVARAARLYNTNADAAIALEISPRSFARICRELQIESPWQRQRRASRRPATRP